MTKTFANRSEPPLILASSSPYRRELLSRLRLEFKCISPDLDESVLPGEAPQQTSERLALAKARAVAQQNPQAVVIGSDQVAVIDGQAVSKPGNHEAAVAQLQAMRGRSIVFYSAVAVLKGDECAPRTFCVPTTVRFRQLTDAEIERYLRAEQPYDCAGSAKSEALGITLLEGIISDDPTALPGLPLIALSSVLREFGYELP
jgi:septum formation protein